MTRCANCKEWLPDALETDALVAAARADERERLRERVVRFPGAISDLTDYERGFNAAVREVFGPNSMPEKPPRHIAPRNYAEARALLDDSLNDIPPYSRVPPGGEGL